MTSGKGWPRPCFTTTQARAGALLHQRHLGRHQGRLGGHRGLLLPRQDCLQVTIISDWIALD